MMTMKDIPATNKQKLTDCCLRSESKSSRNGASKDSRTRVTVVLKRLFFTIIVSSASIFTTTTTTTTTTGRILSVEAFLLSSSSYPLKKTMTSDMLNINPRHFTRRAQSSRTIATTKRGRSSISSSPYPATTTRLSSSSSSSTTNSSIDENDNLRTNTTSVTSRLVDKATSLPPMIQLVVALILYLFHTIVLTQISIPFPFQLIPNERGHFQSIGLDSLVGIATLVAYQYSRHRQVLQQQQATESVDNRERCVGNLQSLFRAPTSENELPWKGVYSSKYSAWTSFGTFWILLIVWRRIGNWNIAIEDILYEMAAGDNALLPITVPMHRSLSVLLGHISWIFAASMVLRWIPRPQSFFQQRPNGSPKLSTSQQTFPASSSKWFRSNYRSTNWVWWSIGGYFVSSWLFKISDFINAYVLPTKFLEMAASSSVVSQLINPEGQDWLASFVGFIAPCITAPWFEEVLYRGFLLPALTTWIPVLLPDTSFDASQSERTDNNGSLKLQWTYYWSIFWSGVLFSMHHVSLTSFIPLCVLGWTWAVIYAKSQNLWTTVVIHAMWNSRIFLASWL